MCVNISARFLDCVGPVDLLFGLLIVAGIQYGQRYPLYLWFVCFCRMAVFRIHLGDPVAVKTVRNKRNNTLCDVWLSCWDRLDLGVMDRLGTMGHCPGAPGGGAIYRLVEPPFCSAQIMQRLMAFGGVLSSAVMFKLYLCCVSVHE